MHNLGNIGKRKKSNFYTHVCNLSLSNLGIGSNCERLGRSPLFPGSTTRIHFSIAGVVHIQKVLMEYFAKKHHKYQKCCLSLIKYSY